MQLDILYLNMYGWIGCNSLYFKYINNADYTGTLEHWLELHNYTLGLLVREMGSDKYIVQLSVDTGWGGSNLRSERNNVGYCCCCVVAVVFSSGGWTAGHTAQ